eukprot:COSAG06_NODE_66721_length_253_cov_1.584416_1_plen_37_part_10
MICVAANWGAALGRRGQTRDEMRVGEAFRGDAVIMMT